MYDVADCLVVCIRCSIVGLNVLPCYYDLGLLYIDCVVDFMIESISGVNNGYEWNTLWHELLYGMKCIGACMVVWHILSCGL